MALAIFAPLSYSPLSPMMFAHRTRTYIKCLQLGLTVEHFGEEGHLASEVACGYICVISIVQREKLVSRAEQPVRARSTISIGISLMLHNATRCIQGEKLHNSTSVCDGS